MIIFKARKSSILKTSLDIFDIRPHDVHILYVNRRTQVQTNGRIDSLISVYNQKYSLLGGGGGGGIIILVAILHRENELGASRVMPLFYNAVQLYSTSLGQYQIYFSPSAKSGVISLNFFM